MDTKRRYTLGKNERLKSRKAIAVLFASGKSFSLFPFRAVFRFAEPEPGDGGDRGMVVLPAFSVSKRHFPSAVKRNRVRRMMKETFRLSKSMLQEHSFPRKFRMELFIIFQGNEIPEYAHLLQRMQALVQRLKKETEIKLVNDDAAN